MFKIYILSILCTFSLMAMEKKSSSTIQTASSTIEIDEDQKMFNNIFKELESLKEGVQLSEEKLKYYDDKLKLVKGKDQIKNDCLKEAIRMKQTKLVHMLIKNGANAPVNLAQAIDLELVGVVKSYIHTLKRKFTIDHLDRAIEKALNNPSKESIDIAILLLKNLPSIDDNLFKNKDIPVKYIYFIINSHSPECIYDIWYYFSPMTHKDYFSSISMELHQLALNSNNIKDNPAQHLRQLSKDIACKFNMAIIASLKEPIKRDDINYFKYMFSFLTDQINIEELKEFEELIEYAYNSPNKSFLSFLGKKNSYAEKYAKELMVKKLKYHASELSYISDVVDNENYAPLDYNNLDPFAGEKISVGRYVPSDEITPVRDTEQNISLNSSSAENIEKNLCAIFANLNQQLIEYLVGNLKCRYKKNENVIVTMNGNNEKILNIIFNALTKHRFSATKDLNNIKIDTLKMSISANELIELNHDLTNNFSKYLKKEAKKIIIDSKDIDIRDNEIITPTFSKNPYRKYYNKNNITTSWNGFINKDKDIKNPQKSKKHKNKNSHHQPKKETSPKTTHNNNKTPNQKTPQRIADKSKNKFNDDYQLTDEKPMIYRSQLIDETPKVFKDNNTSKNRENNIKLYRNDFETLLYNYYDLFKKIPNDNKVREIFNHGIMAIDASKINDENYIKNINYGLYSFDKSIIHELNSLYNKFKEKYDIYLVENADDRIVQIKHLLKWLEEKYDNIIINENAAKGYLFILGEHLSRLSNDNQEVVINLIGNYELLMNILMNIKNFRNAIKHGEDNKITTNEATYIIGNEPIANYKALLKDLWQAIKNKEADKT